MAFNFSEFQRFAQNFGALSTEFERWLYSFLASEGLRFIAGVKRRTPVDTGDLRARWQLEEITREGNELRCWFTNNMEYATFVEYGHAKPYRAGAPEGSADWVPGYFMMTVTLDEINRRMPARFERQFREFLLSMGVL